VSRFPLHFARAATEDARAARRYYEARSLRAAGRFVAELDHAIERVCDAPQRWPVYFESFRRYVFDRFPYSLVYRIHDGRIEVLAVAHHKRRPGYWCRS